MTLPPPLKWFPKPMMAGDTAGQGQLKMLGKPDISLTELLVREAAQNSWDARLPQTVPLFELRLRKLDDAARQLLRTHIFTDYPAGHALAEVLGAQELTVLEIVDRGTKGLGGPLHNDTPVEPGQVTDYVDFVLTIGAPQVNQRAGGTYGFGKTASFMASSCSTIIIWTRTRDNAGGLTDRFIASAIGDTFAQPDSDGQLHQYTGRQWWARESQNPLPRAGLRFDPAVATDAQLFGARLFERGFLDDETGTSILILQPKGHTDLVELAAQLERAVIDNLWPKITEDQPAHRRMDLSVWLHGVRRQTIAELDSQLFRARQDCLNAIRRCQEGETVSDLILLKTAPIIARMRNRTTKTVGHVALRRLPVIQQDDPLLTANRTITYMRSEAELVVMTKQPRFLPDGGVGWVAVFKPIPDLDAIFAQSEPQAHDNWSPKALEDATSATQVRQAIDKSMNWLQDELSPRPVTNQAQSSTSTGMLSRTLADLVGTAMVNRTTTSNRSLRTGGSKGKHKGAPRVVIRKVTLPPPTNEQLSAGKQSSLFEVIIEGNHQGLLAVSPSNLKVAVDGGSLSATEITHEGWVDSLGQRFIGPVIHLQPGQYAVAEISYPLGLAIDVSFRCEDAQ